MRPLQNESGVIRVGSAELDRANGSRTIEHVKNAKENEKDHFATLMTRIADCSAVIGVIGLGYVGLPLLQAFHAAGFRVLGFDLDERKIEKLRRGENYLNHLGKEMVADMLAAGRFEATADFTRLGEADAVISCVPTPLGTHLEPDLSYVAKTADDIATALRPGQLVVLESTTYPGTTRDVMLPRLQAAGLRCGVDFFVAYSPEREDPGRKDHRTQTIPKLVGGIDPPSGQVATALYRKAIREVIPVSSAEVAEAAKILENVYRAVNIALVNEMKTVLTAMHIDVWEVIAAASTKPFGFQAFYPGPGLGGHCIPIDPYYLTWKAARSRPADAFHRTGGRSQPRHAGVCRAARRAWPSTIGARRQKGVDCLYWDWHISRMWTTSAKAPASS